MVGVVVFLGDLVPAVEDGHAAQGKHEGVQHPVQANRQVHGGFIAAFPGRFDAAQGRGRPAEPGVPQARVVVV